MRELGEEYYALAEAANFDYDALLEENRERGAADPRGVEGRLHRRQPRLRGDGGDRRRRAAAGAVRRRHRRRRRRLRSRERRLVQPRAAERRDAEAAGQPVLRHRDRRCTGPTRTSSPRASRATSTATARSSSARACPTRTSTWRRCASSRAGQEPGRGRAGVRADAVGRLHGDHGDDPDDERVLRGMEELALHRRRERDRARLRRRLAALGHRRHPRGPGPHLRPGRAADRGREPAAGRADQAGAGRACSPTSRTSATRRPTARSSPPRRPTRSAPRRSARPRRSPAR